MAKAVVRNIRLGLFVLTGTLLLILGLYMVGAKRNLFGSTFTVSANFHNVDGLMAGNNVRFAGIDIGTVKSVRITSDSVVQAVMIIEQSARPYIKKNSLAGVGTDGLLGNKLINIFPGSDGAGSIEDGDVLQSQPSLEVEDMARTLSVTNDNMKAISSNLRSITDKINSENVFWSILQDSLLAGDIKSAIVNIEVATNSTARVTGNLKHIAEDIRNGKGTLGMLISDTAMPGRINQIIVKLGQVSDTAVMITGDFSRIAKRLEAGEGSAGMLLRDTTIAHNINKGTVLLNEDLEAVRYSWPFKKYFRKKDQGKLKSK